MQQAERRPRRSLTQQVITELRSRIESGSLPEGTKLPTEVALIEEFGVSRTVIREAIAGLRADGLVLPRHGVGVFVTKPKPTANLSGIFNVDTERLSSIIEALELRAAVEIEAAGLAAERRSPAQMAKILEALQNMASAVAAGDSAEQADFDFHAAIADATNNANFGEFLTFLGRRTIPRSRLQEAGMAATAPGYMQKIHAEHQAIADAIANRSALDAREAMRLHLKGSQERYERLIRSKSDQDIIQY